MSALRTLGSAVAAAAVVRAVRVLPEPRGGAWQRTNFQGRPVSLSGGLAAALGTLAGAAVSPDLRAPSLIAGASALFAGGYDDLVAPRAEHTTDRGLTGHLGALRAGRLSGGVVKVAAIGCGSLLAARRTRMPTDGHAPALLLDAMLIAGTANLVNLFDLRPGRARKLCLGIASASLAGRSGPSAAVVGAVAAGLRDDLAERTMLGDLGANTLGAVLGVRLAAGNAPTRVVSLIVIGFLTLASERVSFTQVIESVPLLRRVDQLGRAPVSVDAIAPMPLPRHHRRDTATQ